MRAYTVVISGVASPAAAFDFLEVNPAAGKPVAITRIHIAQTGEPTTEEEQLALTVQRAHSTSGSGGSAPTPRPTNPSDSAAGFGAETMNTTQATGGSPVVLLETAWNTRAGLDLAFAPEEYLEAAGSERIVVQSGAPSDAVTIRATFWVIERG